MMTEERARAILGETVVEDGLHNGFHYVAWKRGETSVTLDDHFTVKELEAIVWWMKNKN